MSLVCIVGECGFDKNQLSGVPFVKVEGGADIDCENAAVIVGRGVSPNVRSALGVIVDGESFSGRIPRGIQLITCGFSPKNTVSVTSRTDDKITLSLNRAIRTANGTVCEPLEQPVALEKPHTDEYDIMAAFAAKLMLSENA